eukprot:708708-Prorocentrum_minimum.AAC.1
MCAWCVRRRTCSRGSCGAPPRTTSRTTAADRSRCVTPSRPPLNIPHHRRQQIEVFTKDIELCGLEPGAPPINIGLLYMQNANRGGGVVAIIRAFLTKFEEMLNNPNPPMCAPPPPL